jgi:hypothetical protein
MSLPLAALRPCGPLSGVLQTLAAAQQSKLRIIQTNSAGDNIHIIGAATNKVRLNRSGPSRDWLKIKNPNSPAMIRAREAEW